MSRPWMPLYIADYLADTGHLRAAESGAYLHLIMHYWQRAGLPNDDRQLATIAKMTDQEWQSARIVIEPMFQAGWKHKRIDGELERAEEKYQRRAAAGKKGAEAKLKQCCSIATAGLDQCESNAEAGLNHKSVVVSNDTTLLSNSSSDSTSEESRSLGVTRARSTPRAKLSVPWPRNFRDQFWDAYPKKAGKKGALRALERVFAREEVEFDRLLEAVRAYAATADPQFTKDPQTWLNKGCWDDEPPPKRRGSKGFLELSLDIERQGHEREDEPDFQAQSYIAAGH